MKVKEAPFFGRELQPEASSGSYRWQYYMLVNFSEKGEGVREQFRTCAQLKAG
jgi:hypothetical protein